jgi:hypothetical protein
MSISFQHFEEEKRSFFEEINMNKNHSKQQNHRTKNLLKTPMLQTSPEK